MKGGRKRAFALLLCLALLAMGCLKPRTASAPPSPKKQEPIEIQSQPGSATVFSDPMNQHKAWHIKWGQFQMTVVGEKPQVGKMQKVSGEIYENGKPETFKADEAIADQASRVLTLTGRVSIYSGEDNTNLTCDKVVYLAKPQLIHAIGNVTVKSPKYVISGIDDEVAKTDFSMIGSPDMFGEASGH